MLKDFVNEDPESEVDERVAALRELIPCRPSHPEALECPTSLKCCEVAGNHVCLPPVSEAGGAIEQAAVLAEEVPVKPGGCPHAPLERLRCRMPARDLCLHDGQCAGSRKCSGLKCCHNGCLFSCVLPEEQLSTKPGFCPPPSFVDDLPPPCRGGARVNACDADDHCPGVLKCCPGLCSRQCAHPL
ncbi:WAP four-disulfide core domain protein 5-like [Pollicipes pollicipes]|uniref:WAP four-disulfide core domain protein 5-like n=1 Tax=Pollicipes pollicipes TaxID=41117 RepID=UPI00188511DA|nr:WAP four-disulfide core domain protein 5-like [Pollicipes pollicipes]